MSETSPAPVRPEGPPGGSLTRRSLILITVVALLAVALSVPIRNWLTQRAEVAALRADIAASSARVIDLQAELSRWSDPAFISAEARRRLHFVLPGEIGYITIARDGTPAESILSDAAAGAPRGWHSVLWESIEEANSPGVTVVADEDGADNDEANDEANDESEAS